MTKAAIKTIDKGLTSELNDCVSLSARIRLLDSKGWSRGDIARSLTKFEQEHNGRKNEVRYQHVRNVLITPLKGS
jgi:hypothetical protein